MRNMQQQLGEFWEPSQHLFIDSGKTRKTCAEAAGYQEYFPENRLHVPVVLKSASLSLLQPAGPVHWLLLHGQQMVHVRPQRRHHWHLGVSSIAVYNKSVYHVCRQDVIELDPRRRMLQFTYRTCTSQWPMCPILPSGLVPGYGHAAGRL